MLPLPRSNAKGWLAKRRSPPFWTSLMMAPVRLGSRGKEMIPGTGVCVCGGEAVGDESKELDTRLPFTIAFGGAYASVLWSLR
jgi:hypothetical protein